MTSRAERFATAVTRGLGSGLNRIGPVNCRYFQYLEVTVTDSVTGGAIRHARVTCTPAGAAAGQTRNTNRHGRTRFNVTAGNYDLTVRADWYVPEPSPPVAVVVVAGHNTHQPIALDPLHFYLHVDADRDGQVDAQPEAIDGPAPAWAWGAANRGAIIFCNNNDDDVPLSGHPDNTDHVVNQGNDSAQDIAWLEVRRHGPSVVAPPATWTATLSINAGEEDTVRVFATPNAGAAQVLGPANAAAGVAATHLHNIGPLNAPVAGAVAPPGAPAGAAGYLGQRLGMEAVRYAVEKNAVGRDGRVTLTLTVSKPPASGVGPPVTHTSSAQVRVAAWLMPNHLDDAHTVYVAQLLAPPPNDNAVFRAALTAALPAGIVLVQRPNNQDRWMQDCMEIGYSNWPGTNGNPSRRESVMKAHRGLLQALSTYPATLLDADVGFHHPSAASADFPNTYDSTGNLEVTPPVTSTANAAHGAKQYPWGRIYYGRGTALEPFNEDVRKFLEAQEVQSPIPINTDWLLVGHVDEMMSFVPAPPAAPSTKQWRLLMASPRRAYAIMQGAPPNQPMLVGRTAAQGAPGSPLIPVNTTTGAMTRQGLMPIPPIPAIDDPNTANPLTAADLEDWNLTFVQPIIDQTIALLTDEIGLDPAADVIEIPTVFRPDSPTQGSAFTGNMVNMLVVNDTCIIPSAFGPIHPFVGVAPPGPPQLPDLFERHVRNELHRVNPALTVHFIDDWDTSHNNYGDIHCGTNTLRRPAAYGPWLGTPAARWWEFVG